MIEDECNTKINKQQIQSKNLIREICKQTSFSCSFSCVILNLKFRAAWYISSRICSQRDCLLIFHRMNSDCFGARAITFCREWEHHQYVLQTLFNAIFTYNMCMHVHVHACMQPQLENNTIRSLSFYFLFCPASLSGRLIHHQPSISRWKSMTISLDHRASQINKLYNVALRNKEKFIVA